MRLPRIEVYADLSAPIGLRNYTDEPRDIPGLGKNRASLHHWVGQGRAGFTYDIPIVSEGFGPCWAAILYDRRTGRSCMLHVDDLEAKDNQRREIERNMPLLPSTAGREVIIVHGARTHASERSKEYFHRIGCKNVRVIEADSREYHWAIAFYPNDNTLDIVTKNPWSATRYRAFSPAVYDLQERQTLSLREREFDGTWRSLQLACWTDRKWPQLNGHFSPQDFIELTAVARNIWPDLGSPDSVRALLIARQYAYVSGRDTVIPRFLHWLESDKSAPYYDLMAGKKPYATIRVYDDEDMHDFRSRIAAFFEGSATRHLDTNFLLLESPDGRILLNFHHDGMKIFELQKGDFTRTTVNSLSEIAASGGYDLEYGNGFSYCRGSIPRMSPETWAKWRRHRAELEELLG